MTDLTLLCAKNVHFTFNKDICEQIDGVTMGSPLGPVLAGIIMVELENTMVAGLSNHLYFWRRYVDDTFTFLKEKSITFVEEQLNLYHPNLQFTYELVINQRNNKSEAIV